MAGPGWVRPKGMALGQKRKLRPDEEWRIVVRDKYPAYVDWETFERIQAMLRDNRAEYLHNKTRGIPRDGAALLHGIAWCGECGHKIAVRYKGGSRTFAITCASSTASQSASVCARRRSTEAWRPPFWQQSPPPKSTLGLARERRSVNPTRPCGAPRCNRSIASATRPVSPSANSTGSTPTTGSSRPNSSGVGRRRSWSFAVLRKRSRDGLRPPLLGPTGSIRGCARRSRPAAARDLGRPIG